MKELIKKPSAWIPIAMSLAALALVLGYVAIIGIQEPQSQADEGAAARIFQLLLAGQVPIILFFATKWLPQKPREAFKILIVQFLVEVLAFATVFFLEL